MPRRQAKRKSKQKRWKKRNRQQPEVQNNTNKMTSNLQQTEPIKNSKSNEEKKFDLGIVIAHFNVSAQLKSPCGYDESAVPVGIEVEYDSCSFLAVSSHKALDVSGQCAVLNALELSDSMDITNCKLAVFQHTRLKEQYYCVIWNVKQLPVEEIVVVGLMDGVSMPTDTVVAPMPFPKDGTLTMSGFSLWMYKDLLSKHSIVMPWQ